MDRNAETAVAVLSVFGHSHGHAAVGGSVGLVDASALAAEIRFL